MFYLLPQQFDLQNIAVLLLDLLSSFDGLALFGQCAMIVHIHVMIFSLLLLLAFESVQYLVLQLS